MIIILSNQQLSLFWYPHINHYSQKTIKWHLPLGNVGEYRHTFHPGNIRNIYIHKEKYPIKIII